MSEPQQGATRTQKVAIITGASGGIGGGLVTAFRGAGYAVAGTSRSIPSVDEPDYLTVSGDLADEGDARRIVQATLDHFGRIDSLVNNAGLFMAKPFAEYTAADFTALTSANLAAFFHITQPVIAHMAAQGGGHVVTVTTTLVDQADGTRPSALLALTKGGLDAVTRSLAIEYASRGVRVNAVAPGVIRTPPHAAESYAGLAARHPLGRVGDVADITGAVLYLERATFVTGESLHVDGGWAAGR